VSNNNIEQIQQWCSGTWLARAQGNDIIDELASDSRNIDQPDAALFVAIKTHLRNGHTYIAAAWRKGVRNFLVSEDINIDEIPGSSIIKVENTLKALQDIAAAYRSQFTLPVIGITGSNGKTIVKEWLYQLLNDSYNIVRSPKSYNSQIGVPLSVWQLNAEYDLAIFEAGISQPGEMAQLERIIRPDIGIFTNIGEAHSEGFINLQQKVEEKLILFKNAQQLIYCLDHTLIHDCIRQHMAETPNGPKLFTWSQHENADLRIVNIDTSNGRSHIMGTYDNTPISIVIPFTDTASIENAIHCWCVLLLLRENEQVVQDRMTQLQPVSMRLELMAGINNCTIINDTYNSDLTSLHLALNYLDQQRQHPQHSLILSDMLQAGKRDVDIYEEVADQVARHGIKRFIGVGPALFKHKKLSGNIKSCAASSSSRLQNY
jgi:UDP-N-acetylmuramoyl-tripeptide--D-alanyl-D-alanine ligase